MNKPVLSLGEVVRELEADARRARDQELGPAAVPAFRLSDVKRRQLRALPLVLLIFAACVGSIFVVIAWVRPLMTAFSPWYGALILVHVGVAFGTFAYGWGRVLRWFGLRCPYCGAAFIVFGFKDPNKDAASAAEDERRCGSCQSVIIDLAT
jgi:hypothetical protein